MKKSLRLVFMGTPDFAVPILMALIEGPDEVVAVVCQPDKPVGRGKKLRPPPVKILAEENNIQLFQPDSIRSDYFFDLIKELNPDLIVVAAYGKILPSSLLRLPPKGTINVHGSLLPKYRGAAPIQWAVINGETETGVTIMQMDEGMDTGDILLSAPLSIGENDTSGDVFIKMADLGGKTLMRALELLRKDNLKPIKQDDAKAIEAPMLKKEQGHIDWSRSANELHSFIRGLDPWPTAYSFLENKRYRFFKPVVEVGPVSEKPGTISRADKKGLLIATGNNYLLIREIQPEGKKRMSVQACLCGSSIGPGQQFI